MLLHTQKQIEHYTQKHTNYTLPKKNKKIAGKIMKIDLTCKIANCIGVYVHQRAQKKGRKFKKKNDFCCVSA